MNDLDPKYERYQRQILLKEFGIRAQDKLLVASVLVVGAGGLGCPVLLYLAAAGCGTLGIVDDDVVSVSNLHRQVLYTMNDVGSSKAETAAARIHDMNPDTRIIKHNVRLDNRNALDIFKNYDIIIDGTDNFSTRYMINDACVLSGKPLVSGSVSRSEGQVMILNAVMAGNERPVNYRDLFPHPPSGNEVLNCAESGVLGVLTGIIGGMMANETIKLITGIGKPLANRLLTYHSLTNSTYELSLTARNDAGTNMPKSREEFLSMDYDWFCSSQKPDSQEVDIDTFDEMMQSGDCTIVDIREFDETPPVDEFKHVQIPFSEITGSAKKLKGDIILFCQTGQRSLVAAGILQAELGNGRKVYSLRGGIRKWKQHKYSGHER